MEGEQIVDREQIIVNSKFRVSGEDRSFFYNLALRREDWNYVSVVQISMSKSFYMFDSETNVFDINFGDGQGWISKTITPANYSISTLIVELERILLLAPTGLSAAVLTHDSTTNILAWNLTQTAGRTAQLRFGVRSQPAEALGFLPQTTYPFTGVGSTYTMTPPWVVNLQTQASFILGCDKVSGGILQEIFSPEVTTFGAIRYENPDPVLYRREICHSEAHFWHFWLMDEDGESINPMHGQHVIFSLLFVKVNR